MPHMHKSSEADVTLVDASARPPAPERLGAELHKHLFDLHGAAAARALSALTSLQVGDARAARGLVRQQLRWADSIPEALLSRVVVASAALGFGAGRFDVVVKTKGFEYYKRLLQRLTPRLDVLAPGALAELATAVRDVAHMPGAGAAAAGKAGRNKPRGGGSTGGLEAAGPLPT